VPPSRILETPCDTCMSGVPNFAKVSPELWRGAQPSIEGFHSLEAAGVKTIVNLRHTHDDMPALAGTKLKYLWLPEQPGFPEEKDVLIFLKVIENPNNRPVFVHCKEGKDRTGYIVAAYRIIDQGWSADDAIHEMFNFHYNPIFFENMLFLRGLDKKKSRQRVELSP